MRSVMSHVLSNVPQADIPRSSFDRTHGHKTTFNSGYLVPFFVDEVLPGDTFNLKATAFARMANSSSFSLLSVRCCSCSSSESSTGIVTPA